VASYRKFAGLTVSALQERAQRERARSGSTLAVPQVLLVVGIDEIDRIEEAEKAEKFHPIAAQWPIPGIANVRENRSSYASMIVSSSTMKPRTSPPGPPPHRPLHGFRCPTTSVSCVSPSRPGCARTAATRPGPATC
jgi:hypothetical protein